LNPKSLEAYKRRAQVFGALNRQTEALFDLNKSIELNKNDVEVKNNKNKITITKIMKRTSFRCLE
jgi:hypothetical protein